jgi:hypothetical protein
VINNRRRQPQSAAWGQPSISVGHEDLSVIGVCVVTTPIPEVLTYIPLATPFTTCLRATTRADLVQYDPVRRAWCRTGRRAWACPLSFR